MIGSVSNFDALTGLTHSALDAMPMAIHICDAEGRIVRCNQRSVAFWGREPRAGDTETNFLSAFHLRHADGRALTASETPMATALRTGEPSFDIEIVIERPGAALAIAMVNAEPLFGPDGRIEGAVSSLQDISERKASEIRLAEREALLQAGHSRALLEALPAPVYTTDADGRITFFNEAAVEFWGQRPTLNESSWCGSWKLYTRDGAPLPHDQCPMAMSLRQHRAIRGEEAIAERPDGVRVPFVPYPTPLHDADGRLTGAINMLIDISAQKDADARQRVLINELNHRVKNTLASVQAIVSRTLRGAVDLEAAQRSVDQRLVALARTHDLLTTESWRSAGLRAVAESTRAPLGVDAGRLYLEGPGVELAPKAALAVSMALHELFSNAVKHGALSAETGRVSMTWRVEERDGQRRLVLNWRETGGPAVTAPAHRGFGSRLIELGLAGELGGEVRFDFPAEGAACHIDLPLPDAE